MAKSTLKVEDRSDPKNKLLPRSLYTPQTDSRKELREAVDSVLSDRFMIFLSILIVPIFLLEFFVGYSPSVIFFLRICDMLILFLFILEYSAKLHLSSDRWGHFKSPWHLVDLVIIMIPLIQSLALLTIDVDTSLLLLLRSLRLPRVLMIGGRAIERKLESSEAATVEVQEEKKTIIRVVNADSRAVYNDLTWEELGGRLSGSGQEWIDIYDISQRDFGKLSEILRVPESHFKSELVDEIYPHINYVQQLSFVFLKSGEIRYPEQTGHYLTIPQLGIVVICNGPRIISISRHGIDLFSKILNPTFNHMGSGTFVVSVLYGILENMLNEYRSIISEIEVETIRIRSTPRSKLPRDFLDRMYELNKEVSRLASNLVHLKELLGIIISKKVSLDGFDRNAEETFDVLQDDAEYLNDIVDNLLNNTRYIIDLYINYSSFETNRILKILAVITSISVIPTAIGGLFGQNLLNVPFPFYLWQTVLLIAIGMALVTYVFTKLGWLKT